MSVSPAVANPTISVVVVPSSVGVSPPDTEHIKPNKTSTDDKDTAIDQNNNNGNAATGSSEKSVMMMTSKEDRRRYKKLRKKASKFRPESDLSGLVQRDEWEEAKKMRLIVQTAEEKEEGTRSTKNDKNNNEKQPTPKKDDFCPWIGRRRTKRFVEEQDKFRDGFDHRLVLKSLHLQKQQQQMKKDSRQVEVVTDKNLEERGLAAGNNNKKRKRDDSTTNSSGSSSFHNNNIPKWLCLHNPVCVDHIAVLEVHIEGNDLSVDSVNNVLTTVSTTESVSKNTGGHTKPLVPEKNALIATEWFQGPRPQSISDVLLYEKPNQSPCKKSKHGRHTANNNINATKLENILQTMTMTQQQMKQEGYPVVILSQQDTKLQVCNRNLTRGEFRKPSSFSLDEAKAIVNQLHVQVEDEDVPFVMHLSHQQQQQRRRQEGSSDDDIRVFGLDCEMVKTDTGKTELGRITLIQYIDPNSKSLDTTTTTEDDSQKRYKVVMDELVLPHRPILDYVTQYSGLTADLLKDVTTRLEQVQASLLSLVRPQDILVGHSLENDLIATRWVHPTVIDTAVVFRSNASFKHSLKHLCNCLLKKKIQGGNHHCSEEDAAAALELAIGRAEQGPTFAIHAKDRLFWVPTEKKHSEAATVFVGPSQWLQDHITRHPNALHALTCDTIDSPNRKAIGSWLLGPKRRAGLVWANLVVATSAHLTLLGDLLVGFFFCVCVYAAL